MSTKSSKRVMRCSSCGGEDVVRDAWASWSYEQQDWVLAQTFDYTYCEACEADCSIDAITK